MNRPPEPAPLPEPPEWMFDDAGDPDEPTANGVRVEVPWRKHLLTALTKSGEVVTLAVSANVTTILRHHEAWAGVIAYDEFKETVVTVVAPRWHSEDAPRSVVAGTWSDLDTNRLIAWLAREQDLIVQAGEVERGLAAAADTARIHPVRAYLDALRWDGVPRIDAWLSSYLGAPDGLYERGVGPRWLISAVARIFQPGCQVDCTLILEGKTGAGKTRAFRSLVPVADWYQDTGITIGDKDSYGNLRSVWIYGLDELDSLRKGDVTRIKNFLTAPRDHYRPPYAHRAQDFYRQNVFCGTTNEEQYLVDRTGNRRFWPVRVAEAVDHERIATDRDQLWAEAVVRYRAGEKWHVDTPGLRQLCESQQADRMQADPWVEIVADWLKKPTRPEREEDDRGRPVTLRLPFDVTKGVTTSEVLQFCLGIRKGDVEVRHEMRVGAALRDLGYRRQRSHTTNGNAGRDYRYVKTDDDPSTADDE